MQSEVWPKKFWDLQKYDKQAKTTHFRTKLNCQDKISWPEESLVFSDFPLTHGSPELI